MCPWPLSACKNSYGVDILITLVYCFDPANIIYVKVSSWHSDPQLCLPSDNSRYWIWVYDIYIFIPAFIRITLFTVYRYQSLISMKLCLSNFGLYFGQRLIFVWQCGAHRSYDHNHVNRGNIHDIWFAWCWLYVLNWLNHLWWTDGYSIFLSKNFIFGVCRYHVLSTDFRCYSW